MCLHCHTYDRDVSNANILPNLNTVSNNRRLSKRYTVKISHEVCRFEKRPYTFRFGPFTFSQDHILSVRLFPSHHSKQVTNALFKKSVNNINVAQIETILL